MKKSLLLILVFLLLSYTSFSQETSQENSNNQNFNELKLNGLFLVIGALEVAYERILNEESGLGISVFLPIDNSVSDDINYYISPYYRLYFGKKYAAGFFIEGFGMLNSVNDYTYFYNDAFNETINKETNTDFALGIGFGGKWVTKSGFIGELNFGIGRNLFNSSDYEDSQIVGKIGINIGYRF